MSSQALPMQTHLRDLRPSGAALQSVGPPAPGTEPTNTREQREHSGFALLIFYQVHQQIRTAASQSLEPLAAPSTLTGVRSVEGRSQGHTTQREQKPAHNKQLSVNIPFNIEMTPV